MREPDRTCGSIGICSRKFRLRVSWQPDSASNPRVTAFLWPFMPVVDGGVVTDRPADVIRRDAGRRIPVIIGSNRDECTFFVLGDPASRRNGRGSAAASRRGDLERASLPARS